MGGRVFLCPTCRREHFAYHSCNHKACAQCGRAATAKWIQRQFGKQLRAPYFLVTFTVPSELRELFFGPASAQAYSSLFSAAWAALSQKLATAKGFRAEVSGAIAVLHTWTQQLSFHPHLHLLVPGAGLDASGRVTQVRKPKFLVHLALLQAAFRQEFRQRLNALGRGVDPAVWRKSWGVHIQACGEGGSAVKYLGAYVSRTAISDRRMVSVTPTHVTFRWKDRSKGALLQKQTLTGMEFARRYLRHVVPRGLRSVRYYGYCHPAAVRHRQRIEAALGLAHPHMKAGENPAPVPVCPQCDSPLRLSRILPRSRGDMRQPSRGPPVT